MATEPRYARPDCGRPAVPVAEGDWCRRGACTGLMEQTIATLMERLREARARIDLLTGIIVCQSGEGVTRCHACDSWTWNAATDWHEDDCPMRAQEADRDG